MAIYLGSTLLTSSGSGSGGGIANIKRYTSSATVTLSSLGLSAGNIVQYILVRGGQGGGRGPTSSDTGRGGNGGEVKIGSWEISGSTDITVTVGGGGAAQAVSGTGAEGGHSTLAGGGLSATVSTNDSDAFPPGIEGGVIGSTSGYGWPQSYTYHPFGKAGRREVGGVGAVGWFNGVKDGMGWGGDGSVAGTAEDGSNGCVILIY